MLYLFSQNFAKNVSATSLVYSDTDCYGFLPKGQQGSRGRQGAYGSSGNNGKHGRDGTKGTKGRQGPLVITVLFLFPRYRVNGTTRSLIYCFIGKYSKLTTAIEILKFSSFFVSICVAGNLLLICFTLTRDGQENTEDKASVETLAIRFVDLSMLVIVVWYPLDSCKSKLERLQAFYCKF